MSNSSVAVFRFEETVSGEESAAEGRNASTIWRRTDRLIHCPPQQSIILFHIIYGVLLLNIMILGFQTFLLADPI